MEHDRPAAVGKGDIVSFDYGQGRVAPFPQVVFDGVELLEKERDHLDLLPELKPAEA